MTGGPYLASGSLLRVASARGQATCHPLRKAWRAGRCRECIQVASADDGALGRGRREAEAIAQLPRADACRCAAPVVWREGPLTVCRICSREVAG